MSISKNTKSYLLYVKFISYQQTIEMIPESIEGSIGATIKDTRTKSRGRVEVGEGGGTGWGGVEGRGEHADTCN